MAQHNVPNGIPPQLRQPPPQFNGVNTSSQSSSRDSSPSGFNPAPRSTIPASQLPPSRSPLTVAQKIDNLHINSPKFTSTPNQSIQNPGGLNSAFSPINPVKSGSVMNSDGVSNNLNNASGQPRTVLGQGENVPQTIGSHVQRNFAPAAVSQGQNVQLQTPSQGQNVQRNLVGQSQNFAPMAVTQNPPRNVISQSQNVPNSMQRNAIGIGQGQNFAPMAVSQSQNVPPSGQGHNKQRTMIGENQTTAPIAVSQGQSFSPITFNQGPNVPASTQRNLIGQSQNYPPTVVSQSQNVPPSVQFPNKLRNPIGESQNFSPIAFSQGPNVPMSTQKNLIGQGQNFPPTPVSQSQNVPPSLQTRNQNLIGQIPPFGQGQNIPNVIGQNFNQVPTVPSTFAPQPPKLHSSSSQPKLTQTSPVPPQLQTFQSQHGHNYGSAPNLAQQQQNRNLHANRYPQGPPQQQQNFYPQPQQQQQPQNVVQQGFSRLWGQDHFDLLQNPNVLPANKVEPPRVYLGQEALDAANCTADVFRCTVTKIPENNSLLQKSRLPLGVLIHPFKDLTHLPVIQCNVIVRCRACRTYINPFVFFVDTKRWKCNLCYRINELPEEFQFDPVSKSYGDPSRRPEIKASTIEYIAPAEYMLRPPQPAVYLFLFDISRLAVDSGYLQSACQVILEELQNLPGDARTQLGIICFDSALHFFSLAEGLSQPHEMTVLDIDDIFLPCPDNLLVNLKDRSDLVTDLLNQLPTRYLGTYDSNSALGAALQAAHKMISATGGRVTVFQSSLPNVGPGALTPREDPNQRTASEVSHLNPANDFYKRLALECSGQQIAVDLFVLNSQFVDIATLSGISRFSGGCVHHFPLFNASRYVQNEGFERSLRRYLNRKIGFEAVMRIRCTRGLSIHTFHGNFFVRSTDLLSLPNVNPDAGFGMQVSIDESLSDVQSICFQAALLYTSSKGERRIRVHTLCLPVSANLQEIINSADQQCIVGILSKMAVDRSMQSSLSDAREAFINVAIDILSSYKLSQNMSSGMSTLLSPQCLQILPLYISALLKSTAFRTGTSTRLDDRVKAMIDMKTKPLPQLIQMIYPDLYPVHNLDEQPVILNSEEEPVPQPPRLQLSARCLDSKGAFLMDLGAHIIILVGPGVSQSFLNEVLGVRDYVSITDEFYEIPILGNLHNQRVHQFVNYLNDDKAYAATLHVMRDNSPGRGEFYERLVDDRGENALSYHEFLQHLKTQVK